MTMMTTVGGIDMWLDRSLIEGPYLRLCVNEKQYRKAMKDLNVDKKDSPEFVTQGFGATTHTFTRFCGKLAGVVCLSEPGDKTQEQIYALLVHEAVHVWQAFRQSIGENSPSSEFEAYSIQTISQRLFEAYEKSRK
ncbi:MAG: hypothetical protein ACXWXL_03265 [Candidatus Binatia bacterium]